ncbi:hypothetical protein [Dermatobacter hominis]|uniref:hypothetical protein n=1 Tax=Dermatobacter hominis TaxID=2884263 RepID=UPI001D1254E9|nr:hypothetical protein [Dermatobacter hominis]UDY34489.1 hypothetical protein LH044_14225 [Dermatobacter hominis]
MHRSTRTLAALGLALAALVPAACGDDGEDPADATTTTEATTTTADHAGHDATTVSIEGVDYAFEDVPESVPAGTRLTLENTSAEELHELVVFRIPDTETAPLSELVMRPPAELEAMLGAPVTVLMQPPGAPEPIAAVGDGTIAEPGRYALMCFIPIGADPDEYLAAVEAAGGGKPSGVAGGPPHFTGGMYAELTVE